MAASRRMGWTGRAIGPLAVVGVMLLTSSPASAGVSRGVEVPTEAVAVTGVLYADACSAPTACVAVGSVADAATGGSRPLAETSTGTGWTVRPVPLPPHSSDSLFNDVSCTSATRCTAVGQYTGATDGMFAEAWNGTTWAIRHLGVPTGAVSSALYGVSCSAPTACMSVGQYATGDGGPVVLAEAWNGRTWTPVPTPVPAGARTSQLSGVSCTSPTACVAVGWYLSTSGRQLDLSELWNGATWTVEPVPVPAGATAGGLVKVSCTSARFCMAVGGSVRSSPAGRTLAETWDGAAWTIAPTGAGGAGGSFEGVSCPSSTSCTAVGATVIDGSVLVTRADAWNGRTWHAQATPVVAAGSALYGLACPSAKACEAVGYAGPDILAESRHAGAWSVQDDP